MNVCRKDRAKKMAAGGRERSLCTRPCEVFVRSLSCTRPCEVLVMHSSSWFKATASFNQCWGRFGNDDPFRTFRWGFSRFSVRWFLPELIKKPSTRRKIPNLLASPSNRRATFLSTLKIAISILKKINPLDIHTRTFWHHWLIKCLDQGLFLDMFFGWPIGCPSLWIHWIFSRGKAWSLITDHWPLTIGHWPPYDHWGVQR